MTFKAENIAEFVALFEERKDRIRSFKGCTHLELWQDVSNENVFFTYSNWESEAELNHYRSSEFFKETWAKTKSLFAEKPQAWSVMQKSTTGKTQ